MGRVAAQPTEHNGFVLTAVTASEQGARHEASVAIVCAETRELLTHSHSADAANIMVVISFADIFVDVDGRIASIDMHTLSAFQTTLDQRVVHDVLQVTRTIRLCNGNQNALKNIVIQRIPLLHDPTLNNGKWIMFDGDKIKYTYSHNNHKRNG